jgi:H+/Cl- antiporter ClcA
MEPTHLNYFIGVSVALGVGSYVTFLLACGLNSFVLWLTDDRRLLMPFLENPEENDLNYLAIAVMLALCFSVVIIPCALVYLSARSLRYFFRLSTQGRSKASW